MLRPIDWRLRDKSGCRGTREGEGAPPYGLLAAEDEACATGIGAAFKHAVR
jgi:hypothetical protein